MPKRTKHRKTFRIRYDGKAKGNTELHFGEYGLMAKEGAWITANQIEAARIAMTRYMKRGGKVWINIFPNLSLTKKPLETRQGKGKGNPEVWGSLFLLFYITLFLHRYIFCPFQYLSLYSDENDFHHIQ